MEQTRKQVRQCSPDKAIRFFKWLCHKITVLFEPEEVEVTFDPKGHYSYTKVQHKHA